MMKFEIYSIVVGKPWLITEQVYCQQKWLVSTVKLVEMQCRLDKNHLHQTLPNKEKDTNKYRWILNMTMKRSTKSS